MATQCRASTVLQGLYNVERAVYSVRFLLSSSLDSLQEVRKVFWVNRLAFAGDGAEEGGLQVVKLQGLRHVSIVYPIFTSSLYQLT